MNDNNNHTYNNSEDEEDEKPIQPQQQQQQQPQHEQQQQEEEDNKFDVSSLVTQVQQTSSGHRQYTHHQQQPIQRRTTPMILKKTDQATYSDDHISSTTIYDEEEVVVDEATTVSHQPKQACTTTTVTSTTTSTIIKHEKKHISKRKRFLNNLFKPITRCFQQSSKSPSTPEKQKTPTKHQQITKPQQLQPQDEESLAADVDVVDVETYEQTTTTVVTTTVQTQPPHNTSSNNNNNAAQKLKKKKKKKKRSPHDSRSSLAAHSSRGKSKTLLGPQSQQLTGRKTLVLDLDETLVHSKFEPVAGADFQIPIDIEGRQHIVYVMKRPGVDEFLEEMGKIYEVVIFTASLSKYANPLLDQLDKKKVITGRLFREHCTYVDQCYIKDMSRLGRDIDSALIIDNSPACYAFQPRNAMPCTSWFDDQNDTELLQMIPWLQKLSQERTVYETLDQWRQYFGANCQWY